MKEVISWVSSNYEIVILVAACVLDLVLFLFGVFKKNKKEPLALVLESLPDLINIAEKSGRLGQEKLCWVVESAKEIMYKAIGCKPSDVDCKLIESMVEKILSTPQKKGK